MTHEEKLDKVLNEIKKHTTFRQDQIEYLFNDWKSNTEFPRILKTFENMQLIQRDLSWGELKMYDVLPAANMFEGFVEEKKRRLKQTEDILQSNLIAYKALKWTKINTFFVILSVLLALISLWFALK